MSSLLSVMLVTVASLKEGAVPRLPEPHKRPATSLELVLNIPAGRIDVFEAGTPTASYAVSPGRFEFQTPLGSYAINRVEWNPWWFPPASEWAKGDSVTPPGPANPMGRAKLMFDAPLLYLHGTTASNERLLGRPASHGCVRLSNRDVLTLARLVGQSGRAGMTEGKLDSLAGDSARTRALLLDAPVPLEIVYDLVEVVRDRLVIHRDVYRRLERPGDLEPLISAALERAYPGFEIDWMKVTRMVSQGANVRREVAAGSLLKPRAPEMLALVMDDRRD